MTKEKPAQNRDIEWNAICPYCSSAQHWRGTHCETCGFGSNPLEAEVVDAEFDCSEIVTDIEIVACPVCGRSDRFDGSFCQICRVSVQSKALPAELIADSGSPGWDYLFYGVTYLLVVFSFSDGGGKSDFTKFIVLWLASLILACFYGLLVPKVVKWLAQPLVICISSLKHIIPTAMQIGFYIFSLLPGAIAWQKRKHNKQKTTAIKNAQRQIEQVESEQEIQSASLQLEFLDMSTTAINSLSQEKQRDFRIYKKAMLEIEKLIDKYAIPEDRLVRYKCHQCNKSLKSEIELANRKVYCPSCNTEIKIPAN